MVESPGTTTSGHSTDTGEATGDTQAWRHPRHLGLVAVAIIAAVVTAGWLVHWWGPINPPVSGWTSTSTLPAPDAIQVTVQLQNSSHSPVELTDVHLSTPSGSPPPVITNARVVPIDETGAGWSSTDPDTRTLPTTLGPGQTAMLLVDTTLGACDGSMWSGSTPIDVGVSLRSDWGRSFTRTYAADTPWPTEPCPVALPPDTAPPADRAAAVEQIALAFGIAYDANLPAELRISRIQDGAAVEATVAAAPGGAAATLTGVRAVVTGTAFDRPDHAVVSYQLEGRVSMVRAGEAVLTDDGWQVARATVCADLTLAGITCPALPR